PATGHPAGGGAGPSRWRDRPGRRRECLPSAHRLKHARVAPGGIAAIVVVSRVRTSRAGPAGYGGRGADPAVQRRRAQGRLPPAAASDRVRRGGGAPMTYAELLAYCLAKPGAWQDEPWEGDVVVKVASLVFAFLG